MNKNLTIWERLLADSPPVFNAIKMIAFVVLLGVGLMIRFHVGSVDLQEMITTACFIAIFVAQVAVKDLQQVAAAPNLLAGIEGLLPTILDQFADVKDILATKPATPDIHEAIQNLVGAIAQPAAPAAVAVNITNQPAADNPPPAAEPEDGAQIIKINAGQAPEL